MKAQRSSSDNPHSTWKERKQVPLPLVTYKMLLKYRELVAADLPAGAFLSMHATVHQAVEVALASRLAAAEGVSNAAR